MTSPRWEANGAAGEPAVATAPNMVAIKAAEYAASMNGAEVPNPEPVSSNRGAAALFEDPVKTTLKQERQPRGEWVAPTEVAEGSPAGPVSANAGGGATGGMSSKVSPVVGSQVNTPVLIGSRLSPTAEDEPRILPESADRTSSSVNSDKLGQRLARRARENPRDICNQLDWQMYGMLNDDPSSLLQGMSSMPNEDRELVSALVDGLTNFRSTVRQDANMLPAQKIRPLLEMADRLRSQAELTVPTAVLCRKVEGFGKYVPFEPARFAAMRENLVIVYFEVENFQPKQVKGQMWETDLSEEATLYTDSGLLVWSDNKQTLRDECRNRRHDFFAFDKIALPASLSVGRYVLKVSVEDENTQLWAEATVPLMVTAQ